MAKGAVPIVTIPSVTIPSVTIPSVTIPSVTIPSVTFPTLPAIDQITHVALPAKPTGGNRPTGTSTNEFAIGQNGLDAAEDEPHHLALR